MDSFEFARLFYATCACWPCDRPVGKNMVSRYYMTLPETEKKFSILVDAIDKIDSADMSDSVADELCECVNQYECQGFANGFRYCYMILTGMKLLDSPPPPCGDF